MNKNKKDSRIGLRLPESVLAKLRVEAIKQDRSISYLVLQYVVIGLRSKCLK